MNWQRDLVRAGVALTLVLGALTSLTRVYSDTSWVVVTLAAAVLAVALAATARALGFGLVVSTVATLVGLTTFTYTQHLGAGPLVPGPDQVREAIDLFQTGLQQFRDEPAPTRPLDGLLLLTSGGAWLVAFVTHELLVRWRSIGLAMLPAGILWAVPLAVPLPPGRTWPQALPFALAATLTLLVEGDRGVQGSTRATAGASSRKAALTVGAGLGIVAVLAAAVVPGILPGYGAQAWVDLAGGPDPRGYQPIVDIGDRLKLPAPVDIMTVQADRKVYLRLAALDSFDGATWKVGPVDQPTFQPSPDELFPADGQLPREVPMAQTTPFEVEVNVLDLENIYVPVPYQPIRLEGDNVEDMVYSTVGGFIAAGDLEENEIGGRDATGVRSGTRYTVEAVLPAPAYEDLRSVRYAPGEVAQWTQLPRQYARLAETAEEVYAAAGAESAIDKAFALQDWFAGEDSEFTYTLDADALRGDAALEDFVYTTKAGYCEYYATAMAVMLRATGIPARVSVGFLAGRLTLPADPGVGRTKNLYTVSSTDAHAWVEVLFPGFGWVRMEPTPRTDGAIQQPTPQELDPLLTERDQLLEELDQAAEEDLATEEPLTPEDEVGRQQLEPEDVQSDPNALRGGGVPWALLFLLAAVALVATPFVRFRRHAHHEDRTPAERVRLAQQRLHAHAQAYGVGRDRHLTPREIADRWIAEGRVEPDAATRFTALVEQASFSPRAAARLEAQDGVEAEALGEQLEQSLRSSVSPRDRVVAPWRLPATQARKVVDDARRWVLSNR